MAVDTYASAIAQSVNATAEFTTDLHNLLAILNKSTVKVMQPGAAVQIYKTSTTMGTGTAAKGAEIDLTTVSTALDKTIALTYKKYRNVVAVEDIMSMGYDLAVGQAVDSMVKICEKGVRKDIMTALATGTGTLKVTGTFQQAISQANGKLATLVEDEVATPIFFANPEDAYAWIGNGSAVLAQEFGLNYLMNFAGLGNVILDSNVAKGTIYATTCENLQLVAASVAGIPGLDMQVDATGIFAVHTGAKYAHAGVETVIYSGLTVAPYALDRIIKVTVTAPSA